MLSLGIRYLNGFSAASEVDNRDRAEWPPHPGRVFMALAAAHFQTGAAPAERAALEWLEKQDAPQLGVPDGDSRAVVTHFVPVNDAAGPAKAILQSAPLTRGRQPRTFARTWLHQDTVWLRWPQATPSAAVREALAGLCAKVTRIGHSSSLVQAWLADGPETGSSNWLPTDEAATLRLRVATAGTLAELERRFNGSDSERYAALRVEEYEAGSTEQRKAVRGRLAVAFGGEAPVRERPQLSVFQGYAPSTAVERPAVPGTVFSPHLLALTLERQDGPYRHLALTDVLTLTGRIHEALCKHCDDLGPEAAVVISGLDSGGKPLTTPHLAFVPLAFVGHPHADGRLLGIAITLPLAGVTPETRRGVLVALNRLRERGVALGRQGRWALAAVTQQSAPSSLRPETWTAHPGGAATWATVTPIAYDQHAKSRDKASQQAELTESVRLACERIGLRLAPREIILTPVSPHLGVPPVHVFPRLQRKDGSQRRHSHAILVFPEPVRGPILLGAGRYRGYGVCRPLTDQG